MSNPLAFDKDTPRRHVQQHPQIFNRYLLQFHRSGAGSDGLAVLRLIEMKFVPIDPPGTLCLHEALREVVRRVRPETFIEVGCGNGHISKLLCSLGMSGAGLDFSRSALAGCSARLASEICGGQYRLFEADIKDFVAPRSFDLAISCMVMEHVADDLQFARSVMNLARPDGHVVICVPGRMDCWSVEDDTTGHFRRYERDGLREVLARAGLRNVEVRSLAVPIANLSLRIGAWLIGRTETETRKLLQSRREQTETSGDRDIPWKTVFPVWVKPFLNRATLYPALQTQRLFYRTRLGTMMLGMGQV